MLHSPALHQPAQRCPNIRHLSSFSHAVFVGPFILTISARALHSWRVFGGCCFSFVLLLLVLTPRPPPVGVLLLVHLNFDLVRWKSFDLPVWNPPAAASLKSSTHAEFYQSSPEKNTGRVEGIHHYHYRHNRGLQVWFCGILKVDMDTYLALV